MRLSTLLRCVAASAFVSTASAAGAAFPPERPCFDLLFGVDTYTPGLDSTVSMSLVALDDAIHVRYTRIPERNGPTALWKSLHWYRAKTGTIETIPLPTPKDAVPLVAGLRGEQFWDVTVLPTEGLAFVGAETSPDGFKLAAPRWVPVNPAAQVVGNLALLIAAGGTQTLTERELHPRLERGALSLPMRADRATMKNASETPFVLRWAVPKGGPAEGCDAAPPSRARP